MTNTYDDLVPGELWKGDVCTVDDPETGEPKHVAVEEPSHLQQFLTVAELGTRPEVVWDNELNGFVYPGPEA